MGLTTYKNVTQYNIRSDLGVVYVIVVKCKKQLILFSCFTI